MAELTITHTAVDGTLIEGTSKGDGTNTILKANGFRWFRSLGTWGVPSSRDRQPKTHIINRARAALEAAGHTVTVDIDTTHRDPAQAEADRAARQAARVDALEDKAGRRHAAAETAWDRERAATAALPPGGEPIHVGHHSERRHRRAIEKSWDTLGKAVAAQRAAEHADHRADAATRTTAHRYNPVTVANRIQKLDAEHRADQRALDGHTRTVAVLGVGDTGRDEVDGRIAHGLLGDGHRIVETTAAATGERREQITARMAQRADDLAYWRGIRAQQIADGQTGDYSPTTISVGDHIKIRFHGWVPVLRVNKVSVSVETPAPFGGSMIRGTIPYQEIQGHRPA